MENTQSDCSAATGSVLVPDAKTLETLAELAGIDCPIAEIAIYFRVSVEAMSAFLRDTPEARMAIKRGHEEGIERLRRSLQKHGATGQAKAKRSRNKPLAARRAGSPGCN